jgi:sirohydrochlorin cobaltochelatase
MEEPPLIADWANVTKAPNVIVVPFFISDGLHSYEDIPVLLGIQPVARQPEQSSSATFHGNPHNLHGRRLYYASSIGTDPRVADIIVEQATAAARANDSGD